MSLSECQHLNFERLSQSVLRITLNRPEKYNAAGEQMHGRPCTRSGHRGSPPRSTTPDPQPASRTIVRAMRPPATVPDGGQELLTSWRPR